MDLERMPPGQANCRKCKGKMYFEQDRYGSYLGCLRCGSIIELVLTERGYVPAPPGKTRVRLPARVPALPAPALPAPALPGPAKTAPGRKHKRGKKR